jgi:arylsulfatase A-like enzyme
MPLVVSGPGIEADVVREDLVSWVDLAPTILALAGVPRAERLQGRVFLGAESGPEPTAVFAARDRMDEAYDRCRAARDRRYLFIQNDFPAMPWGVRQWYEETSPILQQMRERHAQDMLRFPESVYLQDAKAPEELYDTVADPHCLHNLIARADHAETAARLRAELAGWRERYDVYGRTDERELVAAGLVKDQTETEATHLKRLPEHLRRGGLFDTVQFPPTR